MPTEDARTKVGGIIQLRDLSMIGVLAAPDRPGLAAAVFTALGTARLNAQFIVQGIDTNNESHVHFCVASEDTDRCLELLDPVANGIGAKRLVERRPVSLISIFGPDFRERPGIAGTAFGALARSGVNILAVSTSISTVSCVIDEADHDSAMAALREVFVLP